MIFLLTGCGSYVYLYNLVNFPAGCVPFGEITHEEEENDLLCYPEDSLIHRNLKPVCTCIHQSLFFLFKLMREAPGIVFICLYCHVIIVGLRTINNILSVISNSNSN